MAYDNTKDQYPVRTTTPTVITPPRRAFLAAAAGAELARYSKALAIFVPDGITASITMVYVDDADGAGVTRKFGPGNHSVVAQVRRITAITGAGVEVHVETD